jgi:hypothetical protein
VNFALEERAAKARLQMSSQLGEAIYGGLTARGTSPSVLQYLVARAVRKSAIAMEALSQVNPDDISAIRNLQNEIILAKLLLSWLHEAVVDGQESWNELETQERATMQDLHDGSEMIDGEMEDGNGW